MPVWGVDMRNAAVAPFPAPLRRSPVLTTGGLVRVEERTQRSVMADVRLKQVAVTGFVHVQQTVNLALHLLGKRAVLVDLRSVTATTGQRNNLTTCLQLTQRSTRTDTMIRQPHRADTNATAYSFYC